VGFSKNNQSRKDGLSDASVSTLYSILPALLLAIVAAILLSGCAGGGIVGIDSSTGRAILLAQDNDYIIVIAGREDARSLAKKYLGDSSLYWLIEDANEPEGIVPGKSVVIPRRPMNPTGIDADRYQTVPILCYHRFGRNNGRLTLSPEAFREQMQFLKDNDYRVIPLSDLIDFLKGKKAIPRRSVVLTIDDGHQSIYKIAYPILNEFGFPATVFAYTDYLNNGGLTWKQIRSMTSSGLISVQPHSKTHDNLAVRKRNESSESYKQRIAREVSVPTDYLRQHQNGPINSFAYPFGDASDEVITEVKNNGLNLGLTVQPGGNPAFSFPYLLHRSMIFGDRGMQEFKSSLITEKFLKDS